MDVSMTVNGSAVSGEVEPRTLLVHFLREHLGLTGTHVDGISVKSCSMLAVQADGESVTTIEGLASNGDLHPVQEGFWERHGLQCGFCTPGMIMQSAYLLSQDDDPTEDEIRHGLEGNLCRCTGYHNIVRAVEFAGARLRGEEPPAAEWEVTS